MQSEPSTPVPAESPGKLLTAPVPRLALATLVLGVVSLTLSLVIVGAVVGVVGLILGGLHLRRSQQARKMAWTGFWLSAMSLVASAGFVVLYAVGFRQLAGNMGGPRFATSGSLEAWRGKPCPDFAVTTLEGTSLRIGDLRGRRVVLDFWATWCPPCVQEIPHFVTLSQESSTNDLVIVGISKEDRTVLKSFARSHGMTYSVASSSDVDLPEPFRGIGSIPTTFFLGRDGTIREVVVGYHGLDDLRRMAVDNETPAAVKAEGSVR
jgi:peroxiredoxin